MLGITIYMCIRLSKHTEYFAQLVEQSTRSQSVPSLDQGLYESDLVKESTCMNQSAFLHVITKVHYANHVAPVCIQTLMCLCAAKQRIDPN